MAPGTPDEREAARTEAVLSRLRIPFVRRATLEYADREEDTFLIDIALEGVFVERADSLTPDAAFGIRFAWPGSEIPFRARCRVAWWHADGVPLHSKSLPAGAGLQFTEMSDFDRDRLRALLIEYSRRDPHVRRFLRHWPDADRRGDDPTSG